MVMAQKFLQVRMDAADVERFALAAGARGMTQAQYLVALLELHAFVKVFVEKNPENALSFRLKALNLETVVR
jgi:cell fate (sporulation/competence/biofilm development) regulator YlbF (YheA/YmcA/DUF963 family)